MTRRAARRHCWSFGDDGSRTAGTDTGTFNLNFSVIAASAVPELATYCVLLIGLAGVVAVRRRRAVYPA